MEEITAGRNVRCCFCNSSEINEVLYGKLYKLKNVSTHYFCMLLSAQIAQNGEDHEGILGFLYDDIISELKRGRTLTCHYCKTRGATLECAHRRCRKVFHLPCGRQKFSLHQFFDSFKTYCGHHRPKQKIDAKVLAATRNRQEDCSICFDSMVIPSPKTLWAPCCRKNSWFHWECIQTLALSAGYFFKCPLCNNKNEFTRAMQQMGIYVPEQDAAWEREPNAYQSLMERHNSCDATVCICPQGRQHFIQHTKWELRLCVTCGSQGMHVGCGGLKNVRSWQCPLCSAVTRKNVNGIAPTVAAAPAVQAPVVAATSSETETVLGSTRRLRSSMYGRPVDMPSGVRVTRRGRYPVNNPINNFVNSPANGPVNGPVNVPANGPAISPANGPANSPASGPANSPANGPASSPANGPANSPANGPVNSPVSSPALSTPIRPGPSPTVALGPRCPSSAFIEEKREVITVEDTDEIIDVESSDSEVESQATPSGVKATSRKKARSARGRKARRKAPRFVAAISTARSLSFRKWRHRNFASFADRMMNDCLYSIHKHNVGMICNNRQVVFQTNYFFRDNFHIKIPYTRRSRKPNSSRGNRQGTWAGQSTSMQRTTSKKGPIKKKVSNQKAENSGVTENVPSSCALPSELEYIPSSSRSKRHLINENSEKTDESSSQRKRRRTEHLSPGATNSQQTPSCSCAVDRAVGENGNETNENNELNSGTQRKRKRRVKKIVLVPNKALRMQRKVALQKRRLNRLQEQKLSAVVHNCQQTRRRASPKVSTGKNSNAAEVVIASSDNVTPSKIRDSDSTKSSVGQERTPLSMNRSLIRRSPVNTRSTTRIAGEGDARVLRRMQGVKRPWKDVSRSPRKRRCLGDHQNKLSRNKLLKLLKRKHPAETEPSLENEKLRRFDNKSEIPEANYSVDFEHQTVPQDSLNSSAHSLKGESLSSDIRSPVRTRSRSRSLLNEEVSRPGTSRLSRRDAFLLEKKMMPNKILKTQNIGVPLHANSQKPTPSKMERNLSEPKRKRTRSASLKFIPRSPIRTRSQSCSLNERSKPGDDCNLRLGRRLSVSLQDFQSVHDHGQLLSKNCRSYIENHASSDKVNSSQQVSLPGIDNENKTDDGLLPVEEARAASPSLSSDTVSDGSIFGLNFGTISSDDEEEEVIFEFNEGDFDIEDVTRRLLEVHRKKKVFEVFNNPEACAAHVDPERLYAGLPIGDDPEMLTELLERDGVEGANGQHSLSEEDEDQEQLLSVESKDLSVSRMKAIALTARKFRPPSSIELQQREMLRILQEHETDEETDESSEYEMLSSC